MWTLTIAVVACSGPPVAGRPMEFVGAVGRFSVSARIEPARFRADETAILSVELGGAGDLSAVRPPSLERQRAFAERFTVVGPVERTIRNDGAAFRFPIRVRESGVDRVPRLIVAVYDPTPPRPSYRTLRTPELPITVETSSASAESEDFSIPRSLTAPSVQWGWVLAAILLSCLPALGTLLRSWRRSTRTAKPRPLADSPFVERALNSNPLLRLAKALGLSPGCRTSAEVLAGFSARVPDPAKIARLRAVLSDLDRRRFADPQACAVGRSRVESDLDEFVEAVESNGGRGDARCR